MKCHNCGQPLAPDPDEALCPHCRAARPPFRAERESVHLLIGTVAVSAGVGAALLGWNGLMVGFAAGWPLGLIVQTVRSELF